MRLEKPRRTCIPLPEPCMAMTRIKGLNPVTLLAPFLIVLALFACGGNGDTPGDTPAATGGDETRAGSPAATPVAEMQGGSELTTEEYAAAMEEISTIGDDEIDEALGDFLFNGVFSEAEAERIRSLEASDSWSDDDADFASQTRETLLQAVTGLYDLFVSVFNTILDEMSNLRPPDHLSDLHDNYIAATGEVVQLLQKQLETVKNTDTEVKNREELAAFQAIVNSLDSGPLEPALQQKAEELRAQADAACLALRGPLETELGRSLSFCNAEGSDASSAETSAEPAHTAEMDRESLIALYNATDGPNWTNNDNWLSDEPVGEWHGVAADSGGGVIALDLYSNGLRGEIPSELGQLSTLEYLDLAFNDLSGEIPPELGQLSRLFELSLWENSLSGEIPPELGQLSTLNRLYLHSNDLSGEIPPELGQMSSLDHLNLSGNSLTGAVPAELEQLYDLRRLILGENQLSGCVPDALRDVRDNDLEELNLPFC